MLGGHATPANRSDTEEFVTVLDAVDVRNGGSIYADKGYSSQLNRYVLRSGVSRTASCTRPPAIGN